MGVAALLSTFGIVILAQGGGGQAGQGRGNAPAPLALATTNAMINPYRMLPNWPHLGDIKPGAAIGIFPDGKGGVTVVRAQMRGSAAEPEALGKSVAEALLEMGGAPLLEAARSQASGLPAPKRA